MRRGSADGNTAAADEEMEKREKQETQEEKERGRIISLTIPLLLTRLYIP